MAVAKREADPGLGRRTGSADAPVASPAAPSVRVSIPKARTIGDIRYENFIVLYDAWRDRNPNAAGHGSLKRFGEAVGISERQMSHLKQRRRIIGTGTARRIEVALKLPEGYMDTAHTVGYMPSPSGAPRVAAAPSVEPQPVGSAVDEAEPVLSEAEARRLFIVAFKLDPELTVATLRRLYDETLRSADS
jgi:hypothetical protein